jgi:hypothetical protein
MRAVAVGMVAFERAICFWCVLSMVQPIPSLAARVGMVRFESMQRTLCVKRASGWMNYLVGGDPHLFDSKC